MRGVLIYSLWYKILLAHVPYSKAEMLQGHCFLFHWGIFLVYFQTSDGPATTADFPTTKDYLLTSCLELPVELFKSFLFISSLNSQNLHFSLQSLCPTCSISGSSVLSFQEGKKYLAFLACSCWNKRPVKI